jgi:hypothetical protein
MLPNVVIVRVLLICSLPVVIARLEKVCKYNNHEKVKQDARRRTKDSCYLVSVVAALLRR